MDVEKDPGDWREMTKCLIWLSQSKTKAPGHNIGVTMNMTVQDTDGVVDEKDQILEVGFNSGPGDSN